MNTTTYFLIMLNNLSQIHLKLFLREQLKKTPEATGDLIANKTDIKNTKNPHKKKQ